MLSCNLFFILQSQQLHVERQPVFHYVIINQQSQTFPHFGIFTASKHPAASELTNWKHESVFSQRQAAARKPAVLSTSSFLLTDSNLRANSFISSGSMKSVEGTIRPAKAQSHPEPQNQWSKTHRCTYNGPTNEHMKTLLGAGAIIITICWILQCFTLIKNWSYMSNMMQSGIFS